MRVSTKSLVGMAKKMAVPVGAIATLLFTLSLLLGHNVAHAASSSAAAPLDNSSVAPLVALDNAVEAVAARVTPAVVTVSVTARARERTTVGDDEGVNADHFTMRVHQRTARVAGVDRRICLDIVAGRAPILRIGIGPVEGADNATGH